MEAVIVYSTPHVWSELSSSIHRRRGVHPQVLAQPIREPNGNTAKCCTFSFLLQQNSCAGHEVLIGTLFHFSPLLLGPSRQPGNVAHLLPLPLATRCCSYTEGGQMRQKIPFPSVLSHLMNTDSFWTSVCAFPNANTFTGPFQCNRLKIKKDVWNGTANLNLLLSVLHSSLDDWFLLRPCFSWSFVFQFLIQSMQVWFLCNAFSCLSYFVAVYYHTHSLKEHCSTEDLFALGYQKCGSVRA